MFLQKIVNFAKINFSKEFCATVTEVIGSFQVTVFAASEKPSSFCMPNLDTVLILSPTRMVSRGTVERITGIEVTFSRFSEIPQVKKKDSSSMVNEP